MITLVLSIPLPCSSKRILLDREATSSKRVVIVEVYKALVVDKEGSVTKKLGWLPNIVVSPRVKFSVGNCSRINYSYVLK